MTMMVYVCKALTLNEPPDGRLFLGAWIDTELNERPYRTNQRLCYNFSSYQYAQNIPLGEGLYSFPVEQIEVLDTDTILYLTVYPKYGLEAVTENDVRNLTRLCGKLV